MKNYWILDADYVDVNRGKLIKNANINIRDGIIAEITQSAPPDTVNVYHFSGKFLCPGLMDLHTHLVLDGTYECISNMAGEGAFLSAYRGYANAVLSLNGGVTTVRDVGCSHDTMIYLAKAINRGILAGPSIIPCGRAMQCTGAHASQLGVIADTSDEIMKTIRYLKAEGAQWIKIMATGGACGEEEIGPVLYNQKELELIAEECHRMSLKVCAHALSEVGIVSCVKAGIDTIEHGGPIPYDTLLEMKEKGISLVPTLSIYKELSEDHHWSDNTNKKSSFVAKNQRKMISDAVRAGVSIGLGTDAGSEGFGPHPSVQKEMLVMHEYGMPVLDVIRSATIISARILGKEKQIGSIDVGKNADIIVLSENPLENLSAFSNVTHVFKNGELAKTT